MKLNVYDIIQKPIITEKTNQQNELLNQVVFAVHPKAGKNQIKLAVEQIFNVKVKSVNTVNVRGKSRNIGPYYIKKTNWKKAIVTLAEGDEIDFYEAV